MEAFGKLAKAGNTLIIPADASNVASMVTQAASVFQTVSRQMANQDRSHVSWDQGKTAPGNDEGEGDKKVSHFTRPAAGSGPPDAEADADAADGAEAWSNPKLSKPAAARAQP